MVPGTSCSRVCRASWTRTGDPTRSHSAGRKIEPGRSDRLTRWCPPWRRGSRSQRWPDRRHSTFKIVTNESNYKWVQDGALQQKEMNNWIGLTVKHLWNDAMYKLHNFLGFNINTTVFCLGLHLLVNEKAVNCSWSTLFLQFHKKSTYY